MRARAYVCVSDLETTGRLLQKEHTPVETRDPSFRIISHRVSVVAGLQGLCWTWCLCSSTVSVGLSVCAGRSSISAAAWWCIGEGVVVSVVVV